MEQSLSVDQMVDALIDREGGYMNHPADKGGPTCFGVTEAVARAHGYAGPMRYLPRSEAAAIYLRLYWVGPHFDEVATRSAKLAAELFDTGVNMGPAVAATGRARRILRGARQGGRRNRPNARARSASGRTLPPPGRAPPSKRSLPLRLAREPDW